MDRSTKPFLILCIVLPLLLLAIPATGKSSKRKGKSYKSSIVEITKIESRKVEAQINDLIYFVFRAKVKNLTDHPLNMTVIFKAVDHRNRKLKYPFVLFENKYVKPKKTATLSGRRVMDAQEYKNIRQWKVDSLQFE